MPRKPRQAKSTPTGSQPVASEADRQIACRVICALYGLGIPESQARVKDLPDEVITQIVRHEAEGRRDRVPAILHQHAAKR